MAGGRTYSANEEDDQVGSWTGLELGCGGWVSEPSLCWLVKEDIVNCEIVLSSPVALDMQQPTGVAPPAFVLGWGTRVVDTRNSVVLERGLIAKSRQEPCRHHRTG